jgi:glycosyltransferase involved in cell wall biosynthesis
MAQDPAVRLSVLVLTYQHEKYLPKALEHALAQDLEGEWEIVVCDDASRDGTPQVVKRYQAAHPDRVRAVLRTRNLGPCRSFADALRHCRGRYVALLEGDDFWHDHGKLRRQVQLLERDPGLAFCFHDVRLLHADGHETPRGCRSDIKLRSGFLDIVADNFIPNCSTVVFRNGLVTVPPWFLELAYYDWPFYALLAEHGGIGFVDEPLSTYRIHSGGAWHGADPKYRIDRVIDILHRLDEHYHYRHSPLLRASVRYWEQVQHLEAQSHQLRRLIREHEELQRSRAVRVARRTRALLARVPGLGRIAHPAHHGTPHRHRRGVGRPADANRHGAEP